MTGSLPYLLENAGAEIYVKEFSTEQTLPAAAQQAVGNCLGTAMILPLALPATEQVRRKGKTQRRKKNRTA